MEFAALRDTGQEKSKVGTLNFRKAVFLLFSETPWETALRDQGAEQNWQIFRRLSIELKSS